MHRKHVKCGFKLLLHWEFHQWKQVLFKKFCRTQRYHHLSSLVYYSIKFHPHLFQIPRPPILPIPWRILSKQHHCHKDSVNNHVMPNMIWCDNQIKSYFISNSCYCLHFMHNLNCIALIVLNISDRSPCRGPITLRIVLWCKQYVIIYQKYTKQFNVIWHS